LFTENRVRNQLLDRTAFFIVEGIKSHIGWKSEDMLRHYTVSNEVNQRSVSSKALSQISEETAGDLIDKFKRYNDCRVQEFIRLVKDHCF
jgi:hypothetical protein